MMMFSAPELGDSIVVSILETFRPEIPTSGLPEDPLPTLFTFAREDGKPDLPALDWIAKEWPQSIRVAITTHIRPRLPPRSLESTTRSVIPAALLADSRGFPLWV